MNAAAEGAEILRMTLWVFDLEFPIEFLLFSWGFRQPQDKYRAPNAVNLAEVKPIFPSKSIQTGS